MQYELRHIPIIDQFGPVRLAECLGLPKTTVYSWRQAGVIPAKYHPAILQAAARVGLAITAADFIGLAAATGVDRMVCDYAQ